jgi:hypothetical protein
VRRLEVDFDRASSLTEFEYLTVQFVTAHTPVTVRHRLEGRAEDLIYAIMGVVLSSAPPTAAPSLYEVAGTHRGGDYLKLFASEPGTYTILLGIQR